MSTKTITKKESAVTKPTDSNEKNARLKAVELAVEQIERQFGQGSIMKLGEGMKVAVETIPTGSLSLDLAPVSYTHLTLPTKA